MKRFWKTVAVVAADTGWTIRLDGRPVRTPARAPLILPTPALADAVAAEWAAQGADIDPASIPMTDLANVVIDHVAPGPARFAAPLAAYGANDLFCYRDDRDPALQAEQVRLWNPLLAWAEARYGVEFTLTQGVLPIDQPAATVVTLASAVDALDVHRLAALAPLTTLSGSLVAALAVIEGAFDPADLWDRVSLDELYQERRWGADAAAQVTRAAHKRDWDNAVRFLTLL